MFLHGPHFSTIMPLLKTIKNDDLDVVPFNYDKIRAAIQERRRLAGRVQASVYISVMESVVPKAGVYRNRTIFRIGV